MAAKFPPPSPTFIKARHQGGPQKPKGIVIHGTVSSDNVGTARNIAEWWASDRSPVTSCHYVVDPKFEFQCVGDHTVAYHCGYNTGSIGVELCDEQQGPANRWNDADSKAILRRAARLVAQLCLAYDIEPRRPSIAELKRKGPHGIYGHNDSRLAFGNTSHTDPRDFDWPEFLRLVQQEVAEIKAEAAGLKETFKVLHAPLHGASATNEEVQKGLNRPGVVAVAFSEAYKKGGYLARRPHWRSVVGGTTKDSRGRMVERDVIIMTKKSAFGKRRLARGVKKAANEASPVKIAPTRYLTYAVEQMGDRPIAFLSMHPHAMVRDHWDSGRAKEFRRSMRVLQTTVQALRREYGADLDIVIFGDFNYPDNDDRRYWTPANTFRRLGLEYTARHIDYVAWSEGLELVARRVIDRRANGQDHPWIEAELRRVLP